jgi:hypothetical protein
MASRLDTFMNNNSPHKARAAQEPGLVSLEPLMPALAARWTIGALGRQRLYILSGRFGAERRFCSRYVVFPETIIESPLRRPDHAAPPPPQDGLRGDRWLVHVLNGEQDYTKGRLDLLQDVLTETPDAEGRLEHSQRLGMADDAQQAQQECVEHAIAAGNGKASAEAAPEAPQEVVGRALEEVAVG